MHRQHEGPEEIKAAGRFRHAKANGENSGQGGQRGPSNHGAGEAECGQQCHQHKERNTDRKAEQKQREGPEPLLPVQQQQQSGPAAEMQHRNDRPQNCMPQRGRHQRQVDKMLLRTRLNRPDAHQNRKCDQHNAAGGRERGPVRMARNY